MTTTDKIGIKRIVELATNATPDPATSNQLLREIEAIGRDLLHQKHGVWRWGDFAKGWLPYWNKIRGVQ